MDSRTFDTITVKFRKLYYSIKHSVESKRKGRKEIDSPLPYPDETGTRMKRAAFTLMLLRMGTTHIRPRPRVVQR